MIFKNLFKTLDQDKKTTPLPVKFSANMSEKDGVWSSEAPPTQVGDPDEVPGFSLSPL